MHNRRRSDIATVMCWFCRSHLRYRRLWWGDSDS